MKSRTSVGSIIDHSPVYFVLYGSVSRNKETTSTLLLLLLLLRVICHVLLIKVSDRLEVESISG